MSPWYKPLIAHDCRGADIAGASGCTGNKTKLEYHATTGDLTAIIDPRFATAGTPKTTLVHDAAGRTTKVTNELGHYHDITYNNRDQVLTVANNQSPPGVVSYQYDAKGNLTRITDQLSRQTNYNYDDADRLTSVVDALNKTTSYGYDGNGNRTSVTNARSKTTTFAFDALDRLTSVTDPLSRALSYQYDAAGNVTQRTDARSLVTNYVYDALNRLTTIDYVGSGTTDVGYVYDLLGNRTSMTDGTGTTSYVFDGLNRVTSITFPGSNQFLYAYDYTSNRTQMTYPDGKEVDYTYDEAHRLKSVTDWISKTVNYTYNNAGYLTQTAFPNGVTAAYVYDIADRFKQVTNTGPGGLLSKFVYTLNKVGNREKLTRTIGTTPAEEEDYNYDSLNRITSVTYGDGDTTSYVYDFVGNRTSMTVNGGTPTSYTYDNADQMTAAGGVSYGYDASGNLTSRGTDSFTYDHENRLKTATVAGVSSSEAYNGDGLRMSQTVSGVTTRYKWDVAAGLPVVVNDGAKTYTYGLDLLSQTLTGNGGRNYFNHDGLGSVSELTKSSDGTTALSFQYDVFGALRSGGGGNYWRFTGEQYDSATNFYYLRARFYDTIAGRFLTTDPYRGHLLAPITQNRYTYVYNNPTAFTDPAGLGVGTEDRGKGEDCWVPQVEAIFGRDCKNAPPGREPVKRTTDAFGDLGSNLWDAGADNYIDLNFTALCNGTGFTAGLQVALDQKPHWYVGPVAGTGCGASATVSIAPGQSIKEGVFCGISGTAGGPFVGTAQAGRGGLDGPAPEDFYEVGAGLGAGLSASVGCADLQPLP